MAVATVSAGILLTGCGQTRRGGDLHLKHSVTISTPAGERTFSSVVRLDAFQTYNYNFGGAGWGGISCRLTGDAVRVTVGDRDFFFLLSSPSGPTPAWNQIGLVKAHFAFPNYTEDESWVRQWKDLAQSNRAIDLVPTEYPAIAAMPHNGWLNEARLISLKEAEGQGLRVLRYRLEITKDSVGANPPLELKYRDTRDEKSRAPIGKYLFSEINGTA